MYPLIKNQFVFIEYLMTYYGCSTNTVEWMYETEIYLRKRRMYTTQKYQQNTW